MPLNEKGTKILANMQEQYGKERGEQVFYASKNSGTIKGVDSAIFPSEADLIPDRDRDLDGNIPTEEGGYQATEAEAPKEDTGKTMTPAVPAKETIAASNNIVGSGDPLNMTSIKVGDSSLANWNRRNRQFWGV